MSLFLARLKEYSESDLIELYKEKQVFESYVHAMSLLPVTEYPFIFNRIQEYKESAFSKFDQEQIDLLLSVYHKIISKHPLTTKQLSSYFYHPSNPLATWEMSPVRWALDQLWRCGLIHVLRDSNFNKLYVLAHAWIVQDIPKFTKREIYTHYCLSAMSAMGISTVKDIADYYRIPVELVRKSLEELLSEKRVKKVNVEHIQESFFIRVEDEWLLSDNTLKEEPSHICLLSPFDNLIWYRIRLMNLFEVDYRLESYLPKDQRKYGYFALPILIRGRIVGAIDLKLERKEKTLIIQNITLFNPFEAQYYKNELNSLLKKYATIWNASKLKVSDDCLKKVQVVRPLYNFITSL